MYHGRITKARKKRKAHVGGVFAETQLGDKKQKNVRTCGRGLKSKLLRAKHANVLLGGKNVVCEVATVQDNPANRDYTRRNIITKGAVLSAKTPDGKEIKVKVTSRPGQHGILNAIAL
jgi:small subunit ribosomal protein S8e